MLKGVYKYKAKPVYLNKPTTIKEITAVILLTKEKCFLKLSNEKYLKKAKLSNKAAKDRKN